MTNRKLRRLLLLSVMILIGCLAIKDFSFLAPFNSLGEFTSETVSKLERYQGLQTLSEWGLMLTVGITYIIFLFSAFKKKTFSSLLCSLCVLVFEMALVCFVSLLRTHSTHTYTEIFVLNSWFWYMAVLGSVLIFLHILFVRYSRTIKL
ncbi:hypothetical protein [Ileibacterium valens]|uniref:hypothetical protein n=1 Tax=Ileibacterium valens TaxID=1862668 RepID=UPI002570B3FB|nr:hypothetical protein [Ileibacterium valens]